MLTGTVITAMKRLFFKGLHENCVLCKVSVVIQPHELRGYNCQSGYIEAFLKFYGFEKYITDHLCWGDNKLRKAHRMCGVMLLFSICLKLKSIDFPLAV